MFGLNRVEGPFRDPDGSLLVNEIFYTIQGEGPDAGCPAVFVRLSRCNLRCYFCDTEFERGDAMTAAMVVDAVKRLTVTNGCRLVVITGGEPFLQNFAVVAKALNADGYRVSVETAGTLWGDEYREIFGTAVNKLICSPKTAGLNRELVPYVDAWKYVVAVDQIDETTGLPCKSTQQKGVGHPIYRPALDHPAPIYVQPMDEYDADKNAANIFLARDLAMKHGYRLSLQVHKIVGVR